jgi:hypothetical protein
MKEKIWRKGIVTLPGDKESIRIKPYFSAIVSNINPILSGLGLNPDLHRSLTVFRLITRADSPPETSCYIYGSLLFLLLINIKP